MQIQSLLSNLGGTKLPQQPAGQTKEAAAPTPPATNPALQAAMNEVISSVGQTKVAAAGETLADTLTKEAQALAAADDEAFVRRSKLGGAAFAEEALATFTRAGQAADAVIKQAAAELDPRTIELARLVQTDPERFLKEAQAGYLARQGTGGDVMRDKVRQIHKIATAHYLEGYDALRRALSAA